jgi:hypothetical protein
MQQDALAIPDLPVVIPQVLTLRHLIKHPLHGSQPVILGVANGCCPARRRSEQCPNHQQTSLPHMKALHLRQAIRC